MLKFWFILPLGYSYLTMKIDSINLDFLFFGIYSNSDIIYKEASKTTFVTTDISQWQQETFIQWNLIFIRRRRDSSFYDQYRKCVNITRTTDKINDVKIRYIKAQIICFAQSQGSRMSWAGNWCPDPATNEVWDPE